MGMRVSNNLQRSDHTVYYARTPPPARSAPRAGREVTDTAEPPSPDADVVILAVPDIALGRSPPRSCRS